MDSIDSLFDTIFAPVDSIARLLPFNIDQAKLGILFFLAYPLAMVFSKLGTPTARYYYSLILGLLYQMIIFKSQIVHTLFCSAVVYLLALRFQRNSLKPILVFISAYSSMYHIYRMVTNYGGWRINISFALMMDVCKFAAFAWSYRDGGVPVKDLSEDQNYRKIEKLPTVLEYFSYIYFFPSALVGPFFDFKDFEGLMTKQGAFKSVPHKSAYLWGLQSLVFGILSAVGDGVIGPIVHPKHTLEKEFMEHSLPYRLLFVWASGIVMRLKYHAGFYLAQSGVDASGLSYTGYVDGKPVFDRVLASGRYVELTTNSRVAIERWNASTQIWVKRYVFNRVLDHDVKQGRKPNPAFASHVAFFVVAIWHGFYPSYLLTFFGMWSCAEAAKAVYKARHKFRWIPEPISGIIRYMGTSLGCNFITCGHVVLMFSKCIQLYMTVYYIPILLNLSVISFLTLSGWTRGPKPVDKKKDAVNVHYFREKKGVDERQDTNGTVNENLIDKAKSEAHKLNKKTE